MSVEKIYDPIRKSFVKLNPEEQVRQLWINKLIELGYPKEYFLVEKSLHSIPGIDLSNISSIPQRRVDLLIYRLNEAKKLAPLFLMEFKAESLTPSALKQVSGYNYFVKAPFIAIANQTEILWGYLLNNELKTYSTLIGYQELQGALKN